MKLITFGMLVASANFLVVNTLSWRNALSAMADFKLSFEHSVEEEKIFDEGYCDRIFSTPTQRRICRANVASGNAGGLVTALDSAVKLAVKECREQFKNHRWNCPIEWQPSSWSGGFSPESIEFLEKGTKEASFFVATLSAALTHTVAYACSIGNLTDCSCQQLPTAAALRNRMTTTPTNILSQSTLLSGIRESSAAAASAWQWSGCSENVQFGSFMSRKFLDSAALARLRKDPTDLLSLVQLQNLLFGRKTLSSQLRVNCRCHGLSASCSVKTCFRQPSPFRTIAKTLRRKYEGALLASDRPEIKAAAVVVSSVPKFRRAGKGNEVYQDDSKLNTRLFRRKAKDSSQSSFVASASKTIMSFLRSSPVFRKNLIHYKKSPDFCEPSDDWSFGTHGRYCSKPVSTNVLSERLGMVTPPSHSAPLKNETSPELQSCSTLCCGRGFETKLVYVAESCRCQFRWCCEIKCETCWTTKEVHICK